MNSKPATKLITSNNRSNDESNRKFLLCCTRAPGTPLVAMNMNKHGQVRSLRGSAGELKEPVFTYVAVGEKKKKKKGGGKKLLGLFKAILFETSLAKKIKKRKLIREQKQASKGRFSEKPEESESFNESSFSQESMEIGSGRIFASTASSSLRYSSNSSAITSSSARSSSVSSNSKPFSDRIKSFTDRNKSFSKESKSFSNRNKSLISTSERVIPLKENKQENMQMQELGKGCFGPNTGLCFVLISLFALVFWGKCCAIFCASTWLALVPHLSIDKNSPQNLAIHSPQLDSDYKK